MKSLPFFPPIIETYPHHTNLLAILPEQPFYYSWLYSNYIQLGIFYERKDYYWLDYFEPLVRKHTPLISRQFIDKNMINYSRIDIIEMIKNAIDQGCYAWMFVDTFYIEPYEYFYKRYHHPHDIFILGYDSVNKEFKIADFFKNGKYSTSVTTFDQIYEAFHSSFNNNTLIDGIQLLKVNMKEHYNFDVGHVVELLEDYINSINTSKKYRLCKQPNGNHINDFGIKVYDGIIHYIKTQKNSECIRKMLHILYEHKKLMRFRVNYLLKEKYVDDNGILGRFENIEKSAVIIRNLYMKSTLKDHEGCRLINNIIERLENVREEERYSINELINNINSNLNSLEHIRHKSQQRVDWAIFD